MFNDATRVCGIRIFVNYYHLKKTSRKEKQFLRFVSGVIVTRGRPPVQQLQEISDPLALASPALLLILLMGSVRDTSPKIWLMTKLCQILDFFAFLDSPEKVKKIKKIKIFKKIKNLENLEILEILDFLDFLDFSGSFKIFKISKIHQKNSWSLRFLPRNVG